MSDADYQRQWRARHGARTGQVGRPASAPCGTPAAYRRHLAHHEPTCEACRTAWAKFHKERRRSKK